MKQDEAAGGILLQNGRRHHWWEPYRSSYDEMAASDPIAKEEFDALVEQMLIAAAATGD
jgi:hypothetical protein